MAAPGPEVRTVQTRSRSETSMGCFNHDQYVEITMHFRCNLL